MNLDELSDFLTKLTGKTFIPDKKTGQVWSNFSMTGTSITEGGVNIAFGIKKNGRFVASVSDEHNFLENIKYLKKSKPFKGVDLFPVGKMIESSLPKRVIMMTTPVTGKIKDFVAKVTAKEGAIYSGKGSRITQYEKNRLAIMNKLNTDAWKKELATITDAKATRPDLIHEVGRQYQGLGAVGMSKEIGTGMFSEQYSQ
jgi:hypothetical protein